DFEVNESKLGNLLKVPELKFADDAAILAAGAVPGFASPIGIDGKRVKVVLDRSAAESGNLVVGANEPGYHYRNFNAERDLAGVEHVVADIATVRAGDPCPVTGQPLEMMRGIEVGNIFQLGTKYSEAMNCNYLDADGKSHPMIMGCYGIGVGRAMASVIEFSHDDYGPIWPMSIATYQHELSALDPQKPGVRDAADRLYDELCRAGVEVLYDDRGEKAGSMFSDADLMGIPLRVVVSPKTLAEGKAEFRTRRCRDAERVELTAIPQLVKSRVAEELAKF
ncbi:MAG: proline--tRNA ligase, partial [Lentisphaeria bacterium]|nr:proline--tRNA ligase [Lentisphaeria bacterium]